MLVAAVTVSALEATELVCVGILQVWVFCPVVRLPLPCLYRLPLMVVCAPQR